MEVSNKEKLLMKNETVTNCHHFKKQVHKDIVKDKNIYEKKQ